MKLYLRTIILFFLSLYSLHVQAINCPFDTTKDCTLQRDILNDKTSTGLKYYAPTNYDHRMSGEINLYDATLVTAHQDSSNAPGQFLLSGNRINANFWRTGEIMTRIDLDKAPYYAPTKSAPWTTKEINHGYLEVVVKMPQCSASDDGLCQLNTNPSEYNKGLWPAIWMMPTMDGNWPQNGEIDIAEAYLPNTCYKVATAALHFFGNDARCTNNDCVGPGLSLGTMSSNYDLYRLFHTWGFEWQPDPNSTNGGKLITGYFDNVKIWGPVRSDALPADGPNALRRGFNDASGGYYLIVNLAVGGPYATAPHPQLKSAKMHIRSIKAYSVGSSPSLPCQPPSNIRSTVSADKKQVQITWDAPSNSAAIQSYQVNDWLDRLLWKGTNKDQRSFTDKSLPGIPGIYIYNLYSNCATGPSEGVQYKVTIQ